MDPPPEPMRQTLFRGASPRFVGISISIGIVMAGALATLLALVTLVPEQPARTLGPLLVMLVLSLIHI